MGRNLNHISTFQLNLTEEQAHDLYDLMYMVEAGDIKTNNLQESYDAIFEILEAYCVPELHKDTSSTLCVNCGYTKEQHELGECWDSKRGIACKGFSTLCVNCGYTKEQHELGECWDSKRGIACKGFSTNSVPDRTKRIVEKWADGELGKFGFGKDNPKIQYLIMLLTNEYHGDDFIQSKGVQHD